MYCRWVHAFPKYSTDVLCTLTVQLAGYTHTQRVSGSIVFSYAAYDKTGVILRIVGGCFDALGWVSGRVSGP